MPTYRLIVFCSVLLCLSLLTAPGLSSYPLTALEYPAPPAAGDDKLYLAAGYTDKDEEAAIADPDEESRIGDPGEQATVGDPGEAAGIGDPSEKSGISDPDEDAAIGDPGEKKQF